MFYKLVSKQIKRVNDSFSCFVRTLYLQRIGNILEGHGIIINCVTPPPPPVEAMQYTVHGKKSLSNFPSPAGMSLIKLSWGSNNLIIPVQGEFGQ
jgi:hypothetical protein